MPRTIKLVASFCVVFAVLAIVAGSSVNVAAQKRHKSRPRKAKVLADAPAAVPDEVATKTAEFDKQIAKACEQLNEAIQKAQVTFSEYPFDEVSLAGGFVDACKADGSLSWNAKRMFLTTYGVSTSYDLNVSLNVTELVIARLNSQHGVVAFVSKPGKVHLSGSLNGSPQDGPASAVRLDLRQEDYAQTFTTNVRTLTNNLAAKKALTAGGAHAQVED